MWAKLDWRVLHDEAPLEPFPCVQCMRRMRAWRQRLLPEERRNWEVSGAAGPGLRAYRGMTYNPQLERGLVQAAGKPRASPIGSVGCNQHFRGSGMASLSRALLCGASPHGPPTQTGPRCITACCWAAALLQAQWCTRGR